MFDAYKTQIDQTKADLAEFYQAQSLKISPKGWQANLQVYLEKNYIGTDLAKEFSFLRVLQTDKSNLSSIINDLRAALTTLRDAAKLNPIQYSDKAINQLIEECQKGRNLYYFTSQDRIAAYYATILLSRCSEDFNQFKVALEKAQATVYFKPGALSSRLNQRISEALILIGQPCLKLHDIYQSFQQRLEKVLGEKPLHAICKAKVKAYISSAPNVFRFIELRKKLAQLETPEFLSLMDEITDKQSKLLANIEANRIALAESENKAGLVYQSVLSNKKGSLIENSFSDLKAIVCQELIQQIKNWEYELQRVGYLLSYQLEPRWQQIQSIKIELYRIDEILNEHEKTFCKWHGNIENHELIEKTLPEVKTAILSAVQKLSQDMIIEFKQAIINQMASLPLEPPRFSTAICIADLDSNPFCRPALHSVDTASTAASLSTTSP
ncbi:MAG: hypothetical protein K0Q57_1085 [Gammaproteobacteria bacterium]|nr:hypothetical protein [Gammaproteobacteria bacterium]